MSISNAQISVGTSPILLHTGSGKTTKVIVKNITPTNDVFYGASSVSTSNGLQAVQGETLYIELGNGDSLYAVSSSEGRTVAIIVTT